MKWGRRTLLVKPGFNFPCSAFTFVRLFFSLSLIGNEVEMRKNTKSEDEKMVISYEVIIIMTVYKVCAERFLSFFRLLHTSDRFFLGTKICSLCVLWPVKMFKFKIRVNKYSLEREKTKQSSQLHVLTKRTNIFLPLKSWSCLLLL